MKKGYKQSAEHVEKRAKKTRWSSYKEANTKPNEELLRLALAGLPLPGIESAQRKIRKDAWDA